MGTTNAEINHITHIPIRSIRSIYSRAIERGFDPDERPLQVQNSYLEDAPRSGRPTKQPNISESVINSVRTDRYGREKSYADLAGDLSQKGVNVSSTTVWRVLKIAGFKKTKPTRKPGLTKKMRAERLNWCLQHKDWTIEDWNNVIWSDETSVVLLYRRGGYRVWRKVDKAFVRSCIRERWKGYSEFMFWGCFSYDEKGPCHCWLLETKAKKEEATKEIERLNQELEPIMKEKWEIENSMRRLSLHIQPGRQPQWKWTKRNGKLSRGSRSVIDWYHYQSKILLPKLFPFAKSCQKKRPATIVQEDKAPSHSHYAQSYIYSLQEIERLL
ncbi:hypothetical protein PSPO01_04012 [Paraphaeosphaeria sporulosa]